MTQDTVVVTQEDREAAAALWGFFKAQGPLIDTPEKGKAIGEEFLQAFARHRIAAEQRGFKLCQDAGREAFLNMIADADRWDEDVDGDCDGVSIHYDLRTGHSQIQELCEALGIDTQRYDQTLMERIEELVSEPIKETGNAG